MKAEILILFLIVALVGFACLFAFLSAHTQANNEKVLLDIAQITQALKIYHDENGFYPYGNGVPAGIDNYLSLWPQPANNCGKIVSYNYSQKSSGDDYALTFCLTGSTKGLAAGIYTGSAKGIN